MIHFLLVLIATLPFSSYIFSGNPSSQYVSPASVEKAAKIRGEIANKLAVRYNMKISGIGGGMADCVNLLELDFDIQGPFPNEELRKILIDSVQELLSAINSNEQIRPFLKNYPFTEKEIIISLFIKDSKGKNVYDPEISVASSWQGIMTYHTDDRNNIYIQTKIKEDYATALKIVNEESKNKLSN